MGLMMCDGKFVSRDEVALVPTPGGTESWKPVPHMEVTERPARSCSRQLYAGRTVLNFNSLHLWH